MTLTYLHEPVRSSSSTANGQANSESSNSSRKENLLELLDGICGEEQDDNFRPEKFPNSFFPEYNICSRNARRSRKESI